MCVHVHNERLAGIIPPPPFGYFNLWKLVKIILVLASKGILRVSGHSMFKLE